MVLSFSLGGASVVEKIGFAKPSNFGATLDDLREAVTTIEDLKRIARRVFGGVHPLATGIEQSLLLARSLLRARDTPPSGSA